MNTENQMNKMNVTAIVDKIIDDLSGRKGIGDEWDMVDQEIKDEIRKEWADIIAKGLAK